VGYDLHITRRRFWAEPGGGEIAPHEWLAVVEADPELALNPESGAYFADWSGPSEYPDPWLDYFEGTIYSKNPDSALIDKMVEIARRLGAKVQGEDGEVYPEGGQPPYEEEPDG
jgi:hypothetical protein